MAKETIAFDKDDVLAESAANTIAFSNQTWGMRLTIDDYDEDWARMWGVDLATGTQMANQFHEARVILTHQPFDEALPVLRGLKANYRLVVVTSRLTKVRPDTEAWLDQHYPDIFSDVYFAGLWDEVTEASAFATKAAICKEVGVDFLVDDQPKHCMGVSEVGIQGGLFGDYPWNRSHHSAPEVVHLPTWPKLGAYFDERAAA